MMPRPYLSRDLSQKYLLIAGLYLAQGLPGGLIAYTLPVLMREQGVAQKWISLFSLIALPWSIKLLWSRLLDRSPRKAAYIVLSFVLTAACWLALSVLPIERLTDGREMVIALLLLLLLANFIMASQDIITDGLTVRLLTDSERGFANSLQVVAYKLGMLISGGLFLSYYAQIGWQNGMRLLVLVLALGYVPILYHLYAVRTPQLSAALTPHEVQTSRRAHSLIAVINGFIRSSGVPYWLLLLCAYKLPDGLISTIVRPFAVDYGIDEAIIGRAASYAIILGGISGIGAGLIWRWQRARFPLLLLVLAVMQIAANLGYYALTRLPDTPQLWWAVSLFEPVVDTMSTVILFATMMHYARQDYAGVDYTFQATLLVVTAGIMHLVGGWMTDAYGHGAVFLSAVALSLLTVGLVMKSLQTATAEAVKLKNK
ncbi:MAG: MFS transporter [Neisseria sp.]|nr:MFS transporter [Neisseria sp.]